MYFDVQQNLLIFLQFPSDENLKALQQTRPRTRHRIECHQKFHGGFR